MPEETIQFVRKAYSFPVLVRLWKFVLVAAIYSSLVVAFGGHLVVPDSAREPRARVGEVVLFGILFGWLMSFRTQQAYARWWEGRGYWGQLVNDSRNLRLKADAYLAEPAERARLAALLVRFAEELRDHLCSRPSGPHRPQAVAGEVFALVREWRDANRIDGFAFLAIDSHAQGLVNVCGACERIRSTPLTASYRGLLRKAITGYLILLPWMTKDLGWWAVLFMTLVTYALVSLELIATDIENPFGSDPDDLPLEKIVETIRSSVSE